LSNKKSTESFHFYAGKIHRYMNLAKRVAYQSCFPDYRHGAVLVKGGSVLNTAHNKSNFSSFGRRFRRAKNGKATVHAELGAILGLDRSITEGAVVYVARIGGNGDFKMSKPCPMCHSAMKYVGIKRVVYTINNQITGSYKL
jgi:tRNA(Arg) A34 adenosine deaminase TadA